MIHTGRGVQEPYRFKIQIPKQRFWFHLCCAQSNRCCCCFF
jgi:hypothetical protein